MKKLFSLFLVLVMLSLCAVSCFSVSAYEEVPDGESLSDEDIIAKRTKFTLDDDFSDNTVLVVMRYENSQKNPVVTPEDFDKSLGISEVKRLSRDGAQRHIYLFTLDKNDKQNVLDVIEELCKLDWVLVAEPNAVGHLGSVEMSDELLAAIRDYYNNEELEKDDFDLLYTNMLSKDKYLVRFSLKGTGQLGSVEKIRLGEYKFTTGHPIPMIFAGGALYELKKSYETKVIDDFDVEYMSIFDNVLCEKVGLIYGDANGSWELEIMDATQIQEYLAKTARSSNTDIELADYDRDGLVSILDATAIQKKLAKMLTDSNIGKVITK